MKVRIGPVASGSAVSCLRKDVAAAGEKGLGHGETNAAVWKMVLAAVAPIGEAAVDGLSLRLSGGGMVSSVRLDQGKNAPGLPRLTRVAELRFTFDCPEDFLPRFVKTSELAQGVTEIAWLPHRLRWDQILLHGPELNTLVLYKDNHAGRCCHTQSQPTPRRGAPAQAAGHPRTHLRPT